MTGTASSSASLNDVPAASAGTAITAPGLTGRESVRLLRDGWAKKEINDRLGPYRRLLVRAP